MFEIFPTITITLDAPITEDRIRHMCFLYAVDIIHIQWISPLEVKIKFNSIENAAEAGYHLKSEWGLHVLQDCTF